MINGGNSDRLMSDINVTPFVDVMLVLLVIFMVTGLLTTFRLPRIFFRKNSKRFLKVGKTGESIFEPTGKSPMDL
ncbi:MAG: biopolymer transporter ExbD [Deltaproteobacteria bacterium]|nr:biopolymer transporter ExbD [Deltaproteobacteria bacterium]